MLRLRDRHAVSRNDHHRIGRAENGGGLFGRSAAHVARLVRAAAAACTCPNAPNNTLVNERFMAFDMITERMKPEEPSSAPAMISSLLSSTKPMAAAERPA